MSTTYNTEKLIGGWIQTQQVKLAEDTYYRGMPLEYDSNNDRYTYYSSGPIAGFFLEDDAKVASDNEWGSIICGGEIQEGGIVTDSNAAYTITEDLIASWAACAFYIKRS